MFSRMTGKRYEGIFMAEAACVKNCFELEPGRGIAVSKNWRRAECMRASICISSILALILSTSIDLGAQTGTKNPTSPTKLGLTLEVATTNEDGSPQALRFTLTNEGDTGVDLPMPALDCVTSNGRVYLHSKIITGKTGELGFGHGCGSGGGHGYRSSVARIKTEWLHLEPGEFLVFTGDGRTMLDKSEGLITYEYWAEYEPPKLSEEDRIQAHEAGYAVPAHSVTSWHLTYSERWPPE